MLGAVGKISVVEIACPDRRPGAGADWFGSFERRLPVCPVGILLGGKHTPRYFKLAVHRAIVAVGIPRFGQLARFRCADGTVGLPF
jgi:hypothetical protein